LRLLFIGLPLLELLGLMVVTDRIGLPATLLEIVLSCALGMIVIRRSGRSIKALLQRFQKTPPNSLWSIIRPLQGLLGGLFLCVPGVLSDLIGLYLAISAGGRNDAETGGTGRGTPGPNPKSPTIIEGEFVQEDLERLN